MIPQWVAVTSSSRGSSIECIHYGGCIAVNSKGETLFELSGTGNEQTFYRSSLKLWQALVPLQSGAIDRFGFNDDEIALMLSSHEGEERHTRVVKTMLDKMGVDDKVLRCGIHTPYNSNAAIQCGGNPSVAHNNCSGKHCGMIAACIHNGWPLETYQHYDHPLQVAIRKEVLRCAQLPADTLLPYGVDGCGVPTYVLPLRAMALMWARVGQTPEEKRLLAAMRAHPDMIAGPGIFDTELSRATGGAILSKRGGAALGCAKVGDDIGVVVKCGDGHMESIPVMMMSALNHLNALSNTQCATLSSFSSIAIRNCNGVTVGQLQSLF